jgi:PAS domain S-box-containing protein
VSKQTDKSRNNQLSPDQDAAAISDLSIPYLRNVSERIPETAAAPEIKLIDPAMQIGLLRHELQETRDKYILLYDYAPNGYVTLNSSALIAEINLTLCTWLGLEKNSLHGTDFTRHLAPAFQEIFTAHLKSVLSGNLKQKCEIHLKKRNGSFIPVRITSIALRDSQGLFSLCYCTINDITPLQQQIDLNHVQNAVSDVSGQAILATDKNLIITQWNKAAQALFGWTKDEIFGSQAATRIRAKILEPLLSDKMMKSLTAAGNWSGEVTFRRKDGSQCSSRAAVGVIWDTSGGFNGLVASFNYLSPPQLSTPAQIETAGLEILVKERVEELTRVNSFLQQELNLYKQAALAARESEGKNRDLVDNIKLGIFRCTPGPKGRFLEVNKAMEEISGYSREELLQISVCDLYSNGLDLDPFKNEINIINWKITHELFLKKKDTSLVTVAVTLVAIRFESGTTLYFDGILEDITERKQAQIQIQQSLNRLQKTIKEIIEAMAYIGEVRDPYTAGHQRRVAQLSLEIGKAMGLQDQQSEGLTMAAFVHDIGKILVPSDILSKPGKLTKPEFDMLRDHTRIGYEILKTIEFPWPIATIVMQHHERINGSGYPFGLTGDQIILEARILAVADVVEAMSSHRPYRPALGVAKALEEILQNRGTLYDSSVVDSCITLFSEKGYDLNSPFPQ